MEKITYQVLRKLQREVTLTNRKIACVELTQEQWTHKSAIVMELFNSGYITGYFPTAGAVLECIVAQKTMDIPMVCG